MNRIFRLVAIVCTVFMSFYATAAGKLVVTVVYPTLLIQGAKNVPMVAIGTDFTSHSVISINGKAVKTTVQGSTMALFTLPVTPASVQVTIRAANGAVSKAFPIRVIPTTPSPKAPVTPISVTPSPVTPISVAPTPVSSIPPASATGNRTWYVRVNGGTRYSSTATTGQCNGMVNAAYSGTGVNQNCAFSDVRDLWTDGSYCSDTSATSSCWKWIGIGGDTYMIQGSIADGVTYRIGTSGPNASDWVGGLPGDPYASGIPAPLSGTASLHTKILGGNYASCTAQNARTQLHGGYGVGTVLNMSGVSYVDVACVDITDFSSCGRNGQTKGCQTSYPLDDYATLGIVWNNKSTNDTLTDVRVHGMASTGLYGPTGDGVVMKDIAIIGNPGAGWNADAGDGTTGSGSLLVQNFDISWNGCAEEYPIVDGLPYQQCTDDSSNGYGDGFGTTTVPSNPGWNVVFSQGTVSYNTQDGLDALHLTGVGSSTTINGVLAYGNMGQQLKAGTGTATLTNNVVVTNCNAMRQAIPGTPAGYNSMLNDYCRASDTGIAVSVGAGKTFTFQNNTVYSDAQTALELGCDTTYGACDGTSKVDYRNNIFLGFLNSTANGDTGYVTDNYSNPIYNDSSNHSAFTNPGSVWSNNLTYHSKSNWACPAVGETGAYCGTDPGLTDETWHVYGYPNAAPTSSAFVLGRAISLPTVVTDILGTIRSGVVNLGAF